MDDEEETKSLASHKSEEKTDDQASPPSGIVTVTVASTAPPPSSPASLTLALPIQNNSNRPILTPTPIQSVMYSGGGSSGGGRDDVWSDKATSILIDAWGERYMELSRGNLKQKHWQEVADIINSSGEYGKALKTDVQCKNRIDTVKKKFKVEKAKVVGGGGASQWQFYDRLDRLIAPPPTPTPTPSSKVSVSPSQEAAIPVGIPFGGRPHLPVNLVNYYNSSAMPLQQHQPQPQPLRHNFPNPISQQRFNFPNNNTNNNNNNNYSNVNSSGRQHQMLLQQQLQNLQHQHQHQQMIRKPPPTQAVEMEVESEEEGLSGDSGDSLPPETGYESRKKGREGMNVIVSGGVKKVKGKGKGKGKGKEKEKKAVKVWGNSVRELTRAILKFGEAYETAESAKLEHIVEMEKERMKFAKELELQRMKFLMKTQLELSQLNGGGGGSDSLGDTSSGRRGGGGGDGGGVENHAH